MRIIILVDFYELPLLMFLDNSAGHEADDIADGGYGFEMPWLFSDESDDVEFKINVPDGIVMAYSKNDRTKLLWQHKVEHEQKG